MTYMIELTADEKALLAEIELDARAVSGGPEAVRRNGERAAELTERLTARNAVPVHRLDYFTKPEFNIGGRGSSRQKVFEGNGTTGGDILRHPHFLPFLRYFVYGPTLPDSALAAFAAKIEECGTITSGDILPLAKLAREQARRHGLDPRESCEEFFKLALEHGLDAYHARTIRDEVRRIA